MDIKMEPSYVGEVKVTYWGQRSSEVKLEERLKIKKYSHLKSWSLIRTKRGLSYYKDRNETDPECLWTCSTISPSMCIIHVWNLREVFIK